MPARQVGEGRKVVAATGTAVVLESTEHIVEVVTIQSELNNTGVVVVGGAGVIAAEATREGVGLYPGDSVVLRDVDLNKVYIDAITNGDGVTFTFKG